MLERLRPAGCEPHRPAGGGGARAAAVPSGGRAAWWGRGPPGASAGPGRSRPWRLVALGHSFASATANSEELMAAASHLTQMYLERDYERLREWTTSVPTLPPEWQEARRRSPTSTHLTPD